MLDVYFLGSLIFYAHLRGYGQKMLYVHPLQKAELSNSFIFNIYPTKSPSDKSNGDLTIQTLLCSCLLLSPFELAFYLETTLL